jgi:hypothetical protein
MVRPQDNFEPKYLQPGVETSGSENNLAFLLKMLSMHSQVSPALLDPEKMDKIESGVSYKLKLTPTLAKVNRRKTGQQDSVKRLVFSIISVINFYHDKNLVRASLEKGASERVKEELSVRAKQCQGALNRLGEAGARISLDSFDELFSKLDVLHQQPRGLFLQDPTLAQTPEELNWLADQSLLDFIASKESEMHEILKLKEIHVEFTPALPQDEAQAITRLGDGASMSKKRFLMEFEDMTEEQAEEELARIRDEEATSLSGAMDMGFGTPIDGDQAASPMDQVAQQIPTAVVSRNLQSDQITAGTMPGA